MTALLLFPPLSFTGWTIAQSESLSPFPDPVFCLLFHSDSVLFVPLLTYLSPSPSPSVLFSWIIRSTKGLFFDIDFYITLSVYPLNLWTLCDTIGVSLPLLDALFHLPPLCVTINRYLSMTAVMFHCPPLCVAIRYSLPLPIYGNDLFYITTKYW